MKISSSHPFYSSTEMLIVKQGDVFDGSMVRHRWARGMLIAVICMKHAVHDCTLILVFLGISCRWLRSPEQYSTDLIFPVDSLLIL